MVHEPKDGNEESHKQKVPQSVEIDVGLHFDDTAQLPKSDGQHDQGPPTTQLGSTHREPGFDSTKDMSATDLQNLQLPEHEQPTHDAVPEAARRLWNQGAFQMESPQEQAETPSSSFDQLQFSSDTSPEEQVMTELFNTISAHRQNPQGFCDALIALFEAFPGFLQLFQNRLRIKREGAVLALNIPNLRNFEQRRLVYHSQVTGNISFVTWKLFPKVMHSVNNTAHVEILKLMYPLLGALQQYEYEAKTINTLLEQVSGLVNKFQTPDYKEIVLRVGNMETGGSKEVQFQLGAMYLTTTADDPQTLWPTYAIRPMVDVDNHTKFEAGFVPSLGWHKVDRVVGSVSVSRS